LNHGIRQTAASQPQVMPTTFAVPQGWEGVCTRYGDVRDWIPCGDSRPHPPPSIAAAPSIAQLRYHY